MYGGVFVSQYVLGIVLSDLVSPRHWIIQLKVTHTSIFWDGGNG